MRKKKSETCDKLFKFTAKDEELMDYAIKQAVLFMQRYGQGHGEGLRQAVAGAQQGCIL